METILSTRVAMPKVFSGIAKLDWGFHSENETRAHLQTLNTKFDYKVWLECDGKRCCTPASSEHHITPMVFKTLSREVEQYRRTVDKYWFHMQIKVGHIKVETFPHAFRAILTLYPETHNPIIKHLDLRVLQNYEDPIGYMQNVKLDLSMIAISFGTHFPEGVRHDLYLPDIFWGKRTEK
ncbi:MAG: hypothetical protein WC505_06215 [Patescibacteria group bacterium]